MDIYTCEACGVRGEVSIEKGVVTGLTLLAENDDGGLMCLPCYMQAESVCAHCQEQGDIFPDTSCVAEPWLCEECLALPYRVHMNSCYSDGCITPEEFAQMSYRELLLEADARKEKNCGGNP